MEIVVKRILVRGFSILPKGASALRMPIKIDGYYDDWLDKPISYLHYGNINYSNKVSMLIDDNYVYLYVKMTDASYTKFNGYNYNFRYEGNQTSFLIEGGDNVGVGRYQLRVRNQDGWTIVKDSNAYITRYSLASTAGFKSDEAEIQIPIAAIQRNANGNSRSISFNSPNLGPQWVTAVGTSTAPFLGIGISILIALGGYFLFKKKRKQIKS